MGRDTGLDVTKAWLKGRVSPGELETRPDAPYLPFQAGDTAWQAFKATILAGDELWTYCSPADPSDNRCSVTVWPAFLASILAFSVA